MEIKTHEGDNVPDEETLKIIEGMKTDGFVTPGELPKTDEEDLDEAEKDIKDKKEKNDEDEKDGEDDAGKSKQDDQIDEDDDEEIEEEREPRDRPIRTIPIWQHKKELKQQEKQFRKEIEDAASKKTARSDDFDEDDEAKMIAKEFGLDEETGPKFVQRLIQVASKRHDSEITREEFQKMQEKLADADEDRKFNDEMAGSIKTIRQLFPDIIPSEVDKIKEKVKELAYTKRYAKYTLDDIIHLNRETLTPTGKKKTGEKGKQMGVHRAGESYDLDNPDSIPWGELSDKEFDQVSTELEKKSSKFKITRRS